MQALVFGKSLSVWAAPATPAVVLQWEGPVVFNTAAPLHLLSLSHLFICFFSENRHFSFLSVFSYLVSLLGKLLYWIACILEIFRLLFLQSGSFTLAWGMHEDRLMPSYKKYISIFHSLINDYILSCI